MPSTWIIADPALGNAEVAEDRGFRSPDAMAQHLEKKWREAVQPGEEVYVVGDLGTSAELFELWMKDLPGRKIRVAGDLGTAVFSDAFWFDVRTSTTFLHEADWGNQAFTLNVEDSAGVALVTGSATDTLEQVNVNLIEWNMVPPDLNQIARYWMHLKQGSADVE